jgi:hypothetical protein
MLLLVRHGQSRANAAGLLIGRADSPLTGLGHQQAVALGEVLASRGVAAGRILTSPLQRAMKTAQVIAAAYASVIEPAALPQVVFWAGVIAPTYLAPPPLNGTLGAPARALGPLALGRRLATTWR